MEQAKPKQSVSRETAKSKRDDGKTDQNIHVICSKNAENSVVFVDKRQNSEMDNTMDQ